MATLGRRLGCWRPIRGPRLSEERFGCGIDKGHLARCRIGARLVINEAVRMMLARELSTRGTNLIGARAEWYAEHLVWRTAPCHRGTSSPVAISAG